MSALYAKAGREVLPHAKLIVDRLHRGQGGRRDGRHGPASRHPVRAMSEAIGAARVTSSRSIAAGSAGTSQLRGSRRNYFGTHCPAMTMEDSVIRETLYRFYTFVATISTWRQPMILAIITGLSKCT